MTSGREKRHRSRRRSPYAMRMMDEVIAELLAEGLIVWTASGETA